MNPLKIDPTRTTLLRKAFEKDFEARFKSLAAAITKLVVEQNIFGLGLTSNVFCPTGKGGGVDPTCSPGKSKKTLSPIQKAIDSTLKDIIAEFDEKPETLTEEDRKWCNEGSCDVLAYTVAKKIPGSKIVSGMSKDNKGHVWIKVKEKHYDAESPEGVNDPSKLKFFGRHGGIQETSVTNTEWTYNKLCPTANVVRKLTSGKYRLYSKSGKNLGTFDTKEAALKHEAEVMMFKAMAKNEEWSDALEAIKFLPNSKKTERFEAWLKTRINSRVLTKVEEGFWVDEYTKKAYQKGVDKAYSAVRRSFRTKEEADSARREFNSIFNNASKEKLKLVQSRTLTDLKGITSAMSSKITAVIIDGLSKGMSADEIGKAINDRVSKIGLSRAKTLARTEIVRAHAEGALDAMESLGVKNVGVNVEWATAKKPCSLCAKLAGVVMTISQARGLFPRHPNCLCSPIPSLQTARIADLRKRISSSVKESPNTEWQGQLLLRKSR